MGILGLTQYVKDNFRDWEDISLSGQPLVLDGNGLRYYLSEKAVLQWEYGGQYPAMREVMMTFMESLLAVNIQPLHIVYDGIGHKEEKMETLLRRRQGDLSTIKKCLNNHSYQKERILPPLVSDVFRDVMQNYKDRGVVKIYSADGEADGIAVTLSNKFNCPLVSKDSDFFVAQLQAGYIPLSMIEWTTPGAPVTAKIYHREAFAASLGISPDLIPAIPAIAGNDIITNLVDEETPLKYRIHGNPQYRGKDIKGIINFIRSCDTLERLESSLQEQEDGHRILEKFSKNFQKAQEIYETRCTETFDEEEFKKSSSIRGKDGRELPEWLIKQYRDFNFSNEHLEVLVLAIRMLPIIPEDFSRSSANLLSRPIRQEIYGLIKPEGGIVTEYVRIRDRLKKEDVIPIISEMNIHTMKDASQDERIKKLFQVLLCDPSTLSAINQEWHIAIASVCYWVKKAHICKDHLQLKSLVLCFTQCYIQDVRRSEFYPDFNISTLHLYTQWQCVYHDAVLLNQVLALPLPNLSPAVLFDGKRVTSYSKLKEREFESSLTKVSSESKALYKKILHIVNNNI